MAMKALPPGRKTRRKDGKGDRNTNGRTGPQRDPVTGRLFGGNPGNKGGSGRPRGAATEFKQFLADQILGSAQMRANLVAIAETDLAALGAVDPALAVRTAGLVVQVAAWAADRVEGRATQLTRDDPAEAAQVAALREMSNEELIADLKTIESEIAH